MSGEIELTANYNLSDVETVTNAKANKLVNDLTGRVKQGSVGAREIAPGSISADLVDADFSAQLGVTDGSVTSDSIVDDAILSRHIGADAVDSEHIADDAVGSEHYQDASILAVHLAAGVGVVPLTSQTHACRVYPGSAFDIVADTSTIVPIDTITHEYPSAGILTTELVSDNRIKVVKKGLYLCTGLVGIEKLDGSNFERLSSSIWINGVINARGMSHQPAPTNVPKRSMVVTEVALDVDDYVQLYADFDNGVTRNGATAADVTYLIVRMIAEDTS